MTAAELRTVTEFLGLDQQWLARHFGVEDRTVRRWIAGTSRHPVPEFVRLEIEQIESHTGAVIGAAVERLLAETDCVTGVWISDEAYARAHPESPYSARWWRHVVARVALEIPGLSIVDADR